MPRREPTVLFHVGAVPTASGLIRRCLLRNAELWSQSRTYALPDEIMAADLGSGETLMADPDAFTTTLHAASPTEMSMSSSVHASCWVPRSLGHRGRGCIPRPTPQFWPLLRQRDRIVGQSCCRCVHRRNYSRCTTSGRSTPGTPPTATNGSPRLILTTCPGFRCTASSASRSALTRSPCMTSGAPFTVTPPSYAMSSPQPSSKCPMRSRTECRRRGFGSPTPGRASPPLPAHISRRRRSGGTCMPSCERTSPSSTDRPQPSSQQRRASLSTNAMTESSDFCRVATPAPRTVNIDH